MFSLRVVVLALYYCSFFFHHQCNVMVIGLGIPSKSNIVVITHACGRYVMSHCMFCHKVISKRMRRGGGFVVDKYGTNVSTDALADCYISFMHQILFLIC